MILCNHNITGIDCFGEAANSSCQENRLSFRMKRKPEMKIEAGETERNRGGGQMRIKISAEEKKEMEGGKNRAE